PFFFDYSTGCLFPVLVLISKHKTIKKWYIRNYEDTAEKNKRREEIIPSADGNHDWIIKVGFK
ncbi:hypothetical protein, partial [Clostridium sp. FS41]|uniref:hypothetical protein n=1 Tax=Clostridium sp. FS41 TaxID=1609975 RepID=UPI001A9A6742